MTQLAELELFTGDSGVPVAESGFLTFRTSHNLASNGSQDLATPGDDGVKNLLKYAFNMVGSGAGQRSNLTSPNTSVVADNGSAGLPRISRNSSGRLQVTYIRRKFSTTPGVSYSVEFGNSLSDMAANSSATEATTSIDSTFERVAVTDSVNSTRRFARVKVVSQ